jgi:hypothetical protein
MSADETLYEREVRGIAEVEETKNYLALAGFPDAQVGDFADPADEGAKVTLYLPRARMLALVKLAAAVPSIGRERLVRIEEELRQAGEHGLADTVALAREKVN